ncbi:hypothetical protein CDL15_Pgr000734 [Punica granatum]|uniref:MADS-box domain-containing protein n=1 Tax=Punica granatum TaxID=22663 RepID=A0A218W5A5_PUNGR|nr:hypothetical protein CDL15_Pgr000734 [Punica granatum]PKI31598.1 hypothetical protein CRG98_047980 [Punica granatum]
MVQPSALQLAPLARPQVVVLVAPEARNVPIPEGRLALLIRTACEFCTLCNIESPTIFITLGGTPHSFSLPEINNANNTRRLGGQAIPGIILGWEAAAGRVHALHQLNDSYMRMIWQLRVIRRRWEDQNGVKGKSWEPFEEPICPLTEFTYSELIDLKEWLGRLMEKIAARKVQLLAQMI